MLDYVVTYKDLILYKITLSYIKAENDKHAWDIAKSSAANGSIIISVERADETSQSS